MNRPRALLLAALCSAALAAPPGGAASECRRPRHRRGRAVPRPRRQPDPRRLADSAAYERLALLVDTFGHRFSGSASLEAAIDWILAEMKRDGLENVRGEPVMVPHWVRGAESAELVSPRRQPLRDARARRQRRHAAGGDHAPVLVVTQLRRARSAAPRR